MVDFETKTITIGGKSEPIKEFACWFRTPTGLHDSLDSAIKVCVANDWPVQGVIVPISVAVGSTIYEEIGRM